MSGFQTVVRSGAAGSESRLALLVASRCLLGATARGGRCLRWMASSPASETARDVVVDSATNLAYVASAEFGLAVVDVSTPAPTGGRRRRQPAFYGARVAVSGSLAVVGSASLGMTVVDVSVPAAPKIRGLHERHDQRGCPCGTVRLRARSSVSGNPPHTDLAVVSLATPATPTIVGQVTLAGGTGIKVAGGLAYVTTGSAGLQIVDVNMPAAPTIVTTVDTPGSAKGWRSPMGMRTSPTPARCRSSTSMRHARGHCRLPAPCPARRPWPWRARACTSSTAHSSRLSSVTLPSNPTLLSSSDAWGPKASMPSATRSFSPAPLSTRYCSKGGLYTVDATDPANPRVLTNVYGGFGSAGVAVSGSLAVASGGSLGMKVVDVSVPTAPRAARRASTRQGSSASNTPLSKDYLKWDHRERWLGKRVTSCASMRRD